MSDIPSEIMAFLVMDGYSHFRVLPTGELAGIKRFIFTTAICVGIDEISYRTRFCYEKAEDAIDALTTWDGHGFPPGYWLKQKPEDVHGPGSKDYNKETKDGIA